MKDAMSPEDILTEEETEREQEAARVLMMERLREALATLTPRHASCLHARFWEGKQAVCERLPYAKMPGKPENTGFTGTQEFSKHRENICWFLKGKVTS